MWIMESILIFLVVSLMSSPVLGISQSTSCSWVNGQMTCEKQTSAGNSAVALSGAAIGGGKTYQDVYAGAGSPGQWDYGRQTVYGTLPGANEAPPSGVSSGVFSSSSSSSSDFIPGQPGGFGFASAGGFPVGGGAFAFGGGYPPQGGFPPQVDYRGFATGGVFPFGGGYPAQVPAGYPDAPNQGQQPQGFDPFTFVRPFFGGGIPGVAAGGFAFGRR